ncbi:hypothetical protein [Delftia phage IME-DE1]|uniref:Uncharacterized protein n=1 Tax=Delftia phage IME-DE1 TaxID=1647385 RepID=A0A0F7IKR9_9CAUD|nr:hypothetical protein AU155_gp47 [Delftia phage IME-DE1]AKG94510.1 hypothetical protein [Delftia phage IME-DE1]
MSPWDKLLRAREESPKEPKQEPKAAPQGSSVAKPKAPRASKAKAES